LHASFASCLLQVTLTNCKFYGFRSVVVAIDQGKVVMRDCLVDLTMKGSYGGEANLAAVVSHLVWETQLFKPCELLIHGVPVDMT
jgi:hypothetical protein